MFTTRCPRCQSEFSIPLDYEGQSVQCTVCEHIFVASNQVGTHVSLSRKADRDPQRQRELGTPKVVSPSQTRWTKSIGNALTEIASLTERLNECHAHTDEYPCSYCNIWVKPFFDYERVSSGGVGLTNRYGVTLISQNLSTRERIRCRECGKLLGASGAAQAKECSVELKTAQSRLAGFERNERRWLELRELSKTRPVVARLLEFCEFFIPAMAFKFAFILAMLVVLLSLYLVALIRSYFSASGR